LTSEFSMVHTIHSLSSPSFNPFDMVFPDLGAQIESTEGDPAPEKAPEKGAEKGADEAPDKTADDVD